MYLYSQRFCAKRYLKNYTRGGKIHIFLSPHDLSVSILLYHCVYFDFNE